MLLRFGACLFHFLLHVLDLNPLLSDIESQARIHTHILVRNPDQGETSYDVPAPVLEKQLVTREREEEDSHVMTEAILAGEEEEKLAGQVTGMRFTLPQAPLALFAKYILMRDRPRDAGDRNCQQKKPDDLQR